MEEQRMDNPGGLPSEIASGGQAAMDAAKRGAQDIATQAKERLDVEAKVQKGVVAKELRKLGSALEVFAEELDKNESAFGEPVRQVAKFCDKSSSSVANKGTRELLHQAESLGRQQPLLFFGATIAAGFLATRLFKADSSEAHDKGMSSSREGYGTVEQGGTERPSPAIPRPEATDVSGFESGETGPHRTT